MGVKRVVQEKLPEGVNDRGLTLTGFLFLHALFIEKGRLETTWTVLRKFGYNNDIRLSDDQLPPPIKQAPDQVTPRVNLDLCTSLLELIILLLSSKAFYIFVHREWKIDKDWIWKF